MIKETVYGQDVQITFYIPVDEYEDFSKLLVETSSARVLLYEGAKEYVTVASRQ